MNQSSVRLVLANRSSVGLSYLLCPFFLLLSICSHCRSHLVLILKILFVPGRTVFPFAFLPPLTSFSFLSFFRSFLLLLSSFLLLYRLVGPFPYFCDSLFVTKRTVSRALFDFHISSSKYDRPTEDRLANTSRTEDWFTESLYNKKVLELENLWRLARSYNHENPYILGEGKTIVLYES